MQPVDDYPLHTDSEGAPPPAPPRRGGQTWIVVAVVAVAAGILVYVLTRPASREPAQGAPSVQVSPAPASEARSPLGSNPQAVELPPLGQMDRFVRQLLRGLSSRPELAAWLATDNLVRNLVAAVDNVSSGRAPIRFFRPLAPSRPFSTQSRGEEDFVVDPRSYARYDGLAAAFASLDATGVSSAYATLRPRLQEAYRELGYPEGNVDTAVERAIVHLLRTPVIEGSVGVTPSPVLYKYSNPRLEALSPAQKQLLRMGPANVRVVQQTLRKLARALGIPEDDVGGRR